jgi:MATE family multidrug resistance protein
MTCDQILNTLPFGLGIAASSRIGNLLGDSTATHRQNNNTTAQDSKEEEKSHIRKLKITSQAATLFATVLGILIAAVLILFRKNFGKLFSDNAKTIDKVASVIPLVASFQIFDGWAAANGGTLRGMGKQHVGAAANLISYYCLALPMGIYLAFRYSGPGSDWGDREREVGMGLRGLWIGNASALCLVGMAEWLIVSWTRWDREIERAAKRAREEEGGGRSVH